MEVKTQFKLAWLMAFFWFNLHLPGITYVQRIFVSSFSDFLQIPETSFSEDSPYLFIAVCVTLMSGWLAGMILKLSKFESILSNFVLILLSVVWLRYGLDKCLYLQFPSDFVELQNDIPKVRFWNWMASHPNLNLLAGIGEVLFGIGILLQKTRFIVLRISFLSFTSILLLNLFLNIGVSIFTAYMLIGNILAIQSVSRNRIEVRRESLKLLLCFSIAGLMWERNQALHNSNLANNFTRWLKENESFRLNESGYLIDHRSTLPRSFLVLHQNKDGFYLERSDGRIKFVSYHLDPMNQLE